MQNANHPHKCSAFPTRETKQIGHAGLLETSEGGLTKLEYAAISIVAALLPKTEEAVLLDDDGRRAVLMLAVSLARSLLDQLRRDGDLDLLDELAAADDAGDEVKVSDEPFKMKG